MYPIPPNATRIRYLESTGTQFIDSGFVPTANTSFEIEVTVVSAPTKFSPFAYSGAAYNSMDSFGACRNNESARCLGYRGSSVNFAFGDGITTTGSVLNLQFLTTASTVKLTNKTSGQTASVSVSSSFTAGSRSLYILSGNAGTADLRHPSAMKLYFCKIYDNGVLVRDFIPVRVGSTGYLFDRVSRQLFGNAGSGDFVLGPDTFATGVIPTRMMPMGVSATPLPYDAEVEYVESTGTQYIDTGVVLDYPGVDSAVEGEVLFTSTDNRQLMGWNYGSFIGVNNGVMDGTASTVAANMWHTMRVERVWAGDSSTIRKWLDGVKAREGTAGSGSPVQYKFIAFGLQANNPPFSYMCKARVRRLRAYRAGVLVLDLRPVRVGSGANAVGYLYDRANPTGGPLGNGLYPNSGTGAFVVGPDKIPS